MDKRYQVFVSSTYDDLQPERQEVMQALLELDCIPAGMELFPAANETQWNFIKKVIRDCDYYIVIVAGRYGSRGPSGAGYTEMEYRYAEEIGLPIIAFLHRDPEQLPAKKTERSFEGQQQLREFRAYLERKLCKLWSSPAELGSVVSRSLVQLMKSSPAIGWVRGSDVGDPLEAARLRARVEELETEIATFASSGPKGAENLAQGDENYTLNFSVEVIDSKKDWKNRILQRGEYDLTLTWNEIIAAVLPPFQVEGDEDNIEWRLRDVFKIRKGAELIATSKEPAADELNVRLSAISKQTLLVQFRALGLIVPSVRQRSLKDRNQYWSLTPFGMGVVTRLCAIPRSG
jgi:hypothetical protein